LVAVLQIGFGAIGIFAAIFVFVVLTGSGILSGDPEARAILPIIGSAVAAFLLLVSAPAVIAGIGLLKRCSWARILMLIVAVLDLLNIPLGTILSIYTIWVLLQEETVRLLSPQVRPN
jgi:hypothetical protein